MIRRLGFLGLALSAALGGCNDLLAIPEDPYLVEPGAPREVPSNSEQPPPPTGDGEPSPPAADDPEGNETSAPAGAGGATASDLDRPTTTELAGDDEPVPQGPASNDDATGGDSTEDDGSEDDGEAGSDGDTSAEPPVEAPDDEELPPAPPPPPACVPERRPVDIVLIADNSPSMGVEIDALEDELNDFAEQLDDEDVDYRLILLSRQRTAARAASEQASTAICVSAPLGALAACPAAAPGASERFLHYDVSIAESDSLDRMLDTFDFPDTHGLAPTGWGERLRVGAAKVVIEVSDGDTARPLRDFLGDVTRLAPEHFGSDPASPGFVFHSITGVRQRAFAAASYLPGEAIELRTCGAAPNLPDNAGQNYQELSRLTGGLRFSICPTGALPLVLTTLAIDVIARSILPCAAPPAAEPDVAATAAQ